MSDVSKARHARGAFWIVAIPFVALAALAAALVATQVENGGRQLGFVAIYYAPMVLYLWATWSILNMLKQMAQSELRYAALPVRLRQIGIALFLGSVFTFAGVPMLTWLVRGEAHVPPFEPSPVMLGIVGAALVVLAPLLRETIEARAELKEFF